MMAKFVLGFWLFSRMRNLYKIEVGAQFPHVIAFRRALSHYALIKWSLTWGERVKETCANRECWDSCSGCYGPFHGFLELAQPDFLWVADLPTRGLYACHLKGK